MDVDSSDPEAQPLGQRRTASQQPNEKLALLVKDFSLVSRLLHVRIYQVFHTSAGGTSSLDCIGFRVAATDEVENDYALFIPRAKGEQICYATSLDHTEQPSPEAIASSILSHLEIIGNRHRDVGRLICRDPEVHVDHKRRVMPRPLSASKKRIAQTQDKRTSRTKQSQQRAMDAIAAAHSQPVVDNVVNGTIGGDLDNTKFVQEFQPHELFESTPIHTDLKSRKSSEASLLHRMAHANATTVWRAELEGIDDDDMMEQMENDSEIQVVNWSEASTNSAAVESSVPRYKRALPDRKPKYTELQRRRDKERHHRLQNVQPIGRKPSSASNTEHSPPKHRISSSSSPSRHHPSVADITTSNTASATIGNAFALKMMEAQHEQEKFLRRKMILENQNRVFKSESVFNDESMGVEITLERPDRRFHTPPHAPPSPDPTIQTRKLSTVRRQSAAVPKAAARRKVTDPISSLSGSASAPVLPSPRELIKVVPKPVSIDEPFSVNVIAPQTSVLDSLPDDMSRSANDLEGPLGSVPAQSVGPLVREDDATLENISIADDAVIFTATSPPDVANNTINKLDTGVMEYSPQSGREAGVIDIHEEPREEIVCLSEQADDDAHEVETPAAHELLLPAGDLLTDSMQSPRVECWEEPKELYDHLNHQENEQMEQTEALIHESNSVHTNMPEQLWASPPVESVITDNDSSESLVVDSEVKADEPNSPVEQADCPHVDVPVGVSSVPDHVEDPTVEVISPGQPQQSLSEPPESVVNPVSPLPLKRSATRRGSIMDAAATAIAMAAAAAAVTAVTVPPIDVPSSTSKMDPKSEAKRTSRKRRSHDATMGNAGRNSPGGATDTKQNGPRRSTIHLLHSAGRTRQPPETAKNTSERLDAKAESVNGAPTSPHEELEQAVTTPTSSTSVTSDVKPMLTRQSTSNYNRQRSQHEIDTIQKSPTYHAKWHKWTKGKQLIDKVSCLQLEERLLQDPTDAVHLVKLGLRYARWPATSLPAVLLLENAAVVHNSVSAHSHDYWNSLGNAHFDVFLRHRKFLPIAIFHLGKSLQAFTRAFAYMESVADPLLLLRYAICMYWTKSEANANLERADDIMRELCAKFSSFCDKDRSNLLFFHFQILCRLKMFNEAIESLSKIIAIHDAVVAKASSSTVNVEPPTTPDSVPQPYDSGDYLLMLMHYEQTSGDFLQSSATFTQILKRLHMQNSEILPDGSTLTDQDYLQLWGTLADKCFSHEDYALAIEFYAIAVTYAKDSRVLARLLYNHALCYQAIGEGIKCNAEFKRAKNINRHVVPFATLADIHARYDDEYTTFLRTPISSIIDGVRQNLYDRAVTSLQRSFRRKKKGEKEGGSDAVERSSNSTAQGSSSGAIRSGLDRRRQSVVTTLTNLVEGSGNRKGSGLAVGVPQSRRTAAMIDPHELFLQRQVIALQKLEKIRGRQLKKSSSMRISPTKLAVGSHSGLLSPDTDRPDLRRKHSMDSLARRLGYLPENREQFAGYWDELVTISLDLYETQNGFNRDVAHIRSILPLVSEAVACCALADALGNVDTALERLHDTTYEQELILVSTLVDIPTILRRHFVPLTESQERTRFPPIQSPIKSASTTLSKHEALSPQKQTTGVSLPVMSPARTNLKAVRLASLIDAQFEDVSKSRTVDPTNDGAGQTLTSIDQFALVDDFRAVNASLLRGWQR